MTAVKEAQPNSVTAIETAEADFNILAHDQYQELAPERRLYTDIPADGTWVDTDAAGALWSTSNTYGLLAGNKIDLSGELGNKLGNIRYGRSASNVPRVQVTLLPTNPQHLVGLQWLQASQSDPIIFPGSPATSGGFTEILGTTTPGPFTFRITSFPTTANPSGVTPFKVKIDTLPVPAPIVRSNG